jgi:hypothetical protein
MTMDQSTKDRIAHNEAFFREINERVQELERERQDDADPRVRWEFLCECGQATCAEPLRMTRAEYEGVRSNPFRFAVLPGHEDPEVERVLERTDRFLAVEKDPDEQDIASATDPRSRRPS